jgi:hypothetical protein
VVGASFIVKALHCCLRGISFCVSEVLFSVEGFLLFGSGGRDARPCVPRVRNGRCPASALKFFEPGPLGDAPGKFYLVLASVNVIFMAFAGVMCAPSC